jgi:hypothetical protein
MVIRKTSKIFVREKIEKAKLKPEENKKDEAEKADLENSEEVEEDKNQGSSSMLCGYFKECC